MSANVLPERVLRFSFAYPTTSLEAENLVSCVGAELYEVDPQFLFSAFCGEVEICRCTYTVVNDELAPTLFFRPPFMRDSSVAVSVLKILTLESEQSGLASTLKITSFGNPSFEKELIRFGFTCRGDKHFSKPLDVTKGERQRRIKQTVRHKIASAEKVGRGYAISIANIDPLGLQALSHEYNEIAWGLTGWAKHAAIAPDETYVIERFAKNKSVVEVGAGSGRVSDLISSVANSTILTDYTPESCKVLESKFGSRDSVIIIQDDITATNLPKDNFDVVLFLENGLGNLLSSELRKRALAQMCSLLNVNGRLILGLRSLEQSPCAHAMVATQCERVIGIYHTFSKDEIQSILPLEFKVEELIRGSERPAGGEAFFLSIVRGGKIIS